jgi:hypothetical protein
MSYLNQLGINNLEKVRLRNVNVKFLNLYDEYNDSNTDNALYWKTENNEKVLYFNGSKLKTGEWNLTENSGTFTLTPNQAGAKIDVNNEPIENIKNLNMFNYTNSNDTPSTENAFYVLNNEPYFRGSKLEVGTELWRLNQSNQVELITARDINFRGQNLVNSNNITATNNITTNNLNSTNTATLNNANLSGQLSVSNTSNLSTTNISGALTVTGITNLNNATSIFSQSTSGNAIFNGPVNVNSNININSGGTISGFNTFRITNTNLNLDSAFTNFSNVVEFKNTSRCNFRNGNEVYIENQDKFFWYESDWTTIIPPQNALDMQGLWDGNTHFSNRSAGYKNQDFHQNFGHYLYTSKIFHRIVERTGSNNYQMSVLGSLDGESTNGVECMPLYIFQSSDNYNYDGASLPSGKSCVEMDRLSVNIMTTTPKMIAGKIQCNEIIANNLNSGGSDFFDFIDSAGNLVGAISNAVGGAVSALILSTALLGSGLAIGAGILGSSGSAMGGSSRNPNDPGDTTNNKILYAGDNASLWNSAFWGRTDVTGNNTFNYLTNRPIGMVLDPTNNNLLYSTNLNRDQLWKFGVNHKSQTLCANLVGLTTDYGTSLCAFSETDIFSNTIPGAYDGEYPCFTYEPIMGRSHGQELCSIALKDYTDFNTARYLDVNTRNYIAVPKTNRLYIQGGNLMFEEDPIPQNKLISGNGLFKLESPTQFSNQLFQLKNELQTSITNRELSLYLSTGSSPDQLNFDSHNLLTPIGGDIKVLGQTHIELRQDLTTHKKNVDMRSTLTFKDASTGNNQGSIFADETLDAIRIFGRIQGDPNYNLEEKMRVGINFINIHEPLYSQFSLIFQQQNQGIYFKDANNNNLLLTYNTSTSQLEFNGSAIGGGGGGTNFFTLSSGTATSASGIDKFIFNTLIEGNTNNANQTPLLKLSKTSNASNATMLIEQGYSGAYLNIGTQYINNQYSNVIYSYGGIEGQSQGNPRLRLIDSRYDGLSAGLAGIEITNKLTLLNQTAIEFDATYGVAQTLGDHLLTLGNNNTDGDNLYFNTYKVLTSNTGLEKTLSANEILDLDNNSLTILDGDFILNNSAITIPQFVPFSTTNKLYADSNGKLNYNGSLVAGNEDKYFTTSASTAVNVLNNMLLRPVGSNAYSELEMRSPWSGGGNYSLFINQFSNAVPAITYGSVASTSNKLNLSVNTSTPQGSSNGIFITNDTFLNDLSADIGMSNWVPGATIRHGAIYRGKYIEHDYTSGTSIIDNALIRFNVNNGGQMNINSNITTFNQKFVMTSGTQAGNPQYAGLEINVNDGGTFKQFYIGGYTADYLVFHRGNGSAVDGYIAPNNANAKMNFTGQHRNLIEETSIKLKEGMILCSTGEIENCLTPKDKLNIPTINEALPKLRLSNKLKEKSIYGVYAGNEDVENHRTGSWGTPLDITNENKDFHFINGSGEGAILVNKENGNIENGDYIMTSSTPGIGCLSDTEIMTNYIVAKATQDITQAFDNEDGTYLISCLYML